MYVSCIIKELFTRWITSKDTEDLIESLIKEIKGSTDLRKINIPHPVVLPKQISMNHNTVSNNSQRTTPQTPPRSNFDICKEF